MDREFPLGYAINILRGRTEHPVRPLTSESFLVGAGVHCQIQLSSGCIPMTLLKIQIDQHGPHLNVMCDNPVVCVNEVPCRDVRLNPGDRISFDSYRFEMIKSAAAANSPLIEFVTDPALENHFLLPPRVSELSAEEIVDRLADELELLESLEESGPNIINSTNETDAPQSTLPINPAVNQDVNQSKDLKRGA